MKITLFLSCFTLMLFIGKSAEFFDGCYYNLAGQIVCPDPYGYDVPLVEYIETLPIEYHPGGLLYIPDEELEVPVNRGILPTEILAFELGAPNTLLAPVRMDTEVYSPYSSFYSNEPKLKETTKIKFRRKKTRMGSSTLVV
ncbi:hypothetical protein ACOME3_003080 [Neoechinorhynchus agilis]